MTGHDPEDDPFDESRIDRRTFVQMSAATAGALALPGNATASVSAASMTEEYEYIVNHTPSDYAVQTLIEFSDESGFAALDALGIDSRQTSEPTTAAYAELTASQAEAVAEIPTAETLSHSPGSNPFWRLGYYPLGVFPEPKRCVDYIEFYQMVDGMEHLESEHPDRVNVFSIGKSPGHDNYLTDRVDPKDVWVAEITNDVDDREAFAEKDKAVFSLSIHGNERMGAEAGCRYIEDLLRGGEQGVETVLDDVALVFVFTNPDGWVAKHPQYTDAPLYQRGNSQVGDTNRQYPTVGWIDPGYNPAEPNEEHGAGGSTPEYIFERVPDAHAIASHLRDYENLTHAADLHGLLYHRVFTNALVPQGQYDHERLHDVYEMCRDIGDGHEGEQDLWRALAAGQEAATGDFNVTQRGMLPEEVYDYGTIYDTLFGVTTGTLISWMSQPEELGGLDTTTIALEMPYSYFTQYDPQTVEMWVTSYTIAIRRVAQHVAADLEVDVETADRSTAYVTTDALTRTSDDLPFPTMEESSGSSSSTTITSFDRSLTASGGDSATSFDVPDETHTLSIHPTTHGGQFEGTLRTPDGVRVDPVTTQQAEVAGCHSGAEWVVTDPAAGEWTIEASTLGSADEVTLDVTMVQTNADDPPDPREVLGYRQREYEVSPFGFFDEYEGYLDDPIAELTREDVLNGEHLAYDNLVVIHDGFDDDAFVGALDEFVEADGNLVLTDRGLRLLADMENSLASGFDEDDLTQETKLAAYLDERIEDHHLLSDTRSTQVQLWNVAPLGYAANDAPVELVDEAAFEAQGGRPAGLSHDDVMVGSLYADRTSGTGIHVIGGLLPPACQANLHPFGLVDYSVCFFGHTILNNALGYTQHRIVDDELVATFGGDPDVDPDPGVDFSASGSREDDATVFTGGQTNTVDVRVEELTHDATITDSVPDGWEVQSGYFDVTGVDEENNVVELGTVSADAVEDGSVTRTYAIEAPEGATETGGYEFGPAEAIAVVDDAEEGDTFAGTDTNYVVGPSTDP